MLVYNIDMYIGGFLVIYKRSPNIKLKKKKKNPCACNMFCTYVHIKRGPLCVPNVMACNYIDEV